MSNASPRDSTSSTSSPVRVDVAARLRSAGLGVALLALTVVAYSGSPRNGFIWDDDDYVVNNRVLESAQGLRDAWVRPGATPQYYPLVFTTFWIESRLWGLNPAGYHVVNLLLHAASSVLVWLILRRLAVPGAWLAAAIFAVHPVHVESVAWITERKNTLSGVLYLGALLTYLGLRGSLAGGNARRWWGRYLLSLVMFGGALLSKSVTASLPAAILVIQWYRTGRIAWREVLWLLPFFVLGALAGLHTAAFEKHEVGALGADFAFTAAERVLIAGRALWFYAASLVWPVNLTFIYPRWVIDAGAAWQWAFPTAAVLLVAVLALLVRRIGRGPLAGVLFFGGTVFPALGFLNIYPMLFSFVADHFQYLASLGLITLFAAAGTSLVTRPGARFRLAGVVAAALLVVVLSALTWRQVLVYRNLETLWRDTLAKNPSAWMAHFNLGSELERQRRTDEAAACYERALALRPCHVKSLVNLAGILADASRLAEAEALLRRALACDPNDGPTHLNLGVIHGRQNRHAEAAACFAQALALNPDLDEMRINYAMALLATGQRDAAVEQLRRLIERKPDIARRVESLSHSAMLEALAAAHAASRDFQRAAEIARRAAASAARAGRADVAAALRSQAAAYDQGLTPASNPGDREP